VSLKRACAALKVSFAIKGKDGNEYHFTDCLIGKYVEGTRKDGVDLNRLKHLPKAIETIMTSIPHSHPLDNPSQKTFFRMFEDRHGMIVFADANTHVIRGFIPSRKPANLLRMHNKNIIQEPPG